MTRTMRAARVVEPCRIVVEEAPVPEPGENEIAVRVEGCGVCASNIPPWEGRQWFQYPMEPGALGHEGWGRVDALGAGVTGFRAGDRVAFLSDHAYAEYDVASADATVHLPDTLAGQPFPARAAGLRDEHLPPQRGARGADGGDRGHRVPRRAPDAGSQAEAGARVIAIARRPFALEVARAMGAAETIPMEDHWQIIERGEGADRRAILRRGRGSRGKAVAARPGRGAHTRARAAGGGRLSPGRARGR